MNDSQRLLVIVALVVIGVVLAWLMLEWGDGWATGGRRILVFYESPVPEYPNLKFQHGIYTAKGIPDILALLFGVALPLCLFATAAFLTLGRRKSSQ